MTDERPSTAAESIAKSVERVSDSKGLQAIGHGIGWGLAALAGAAVFVSLSLPNVMSHWDGHVVPQSKCFDLKEIKGKVYKVNTCTGDAQELIETPLPASAPAKQ
jgi:hypothetical protein